MCMCVCVLDDGVTILALYCSSGPLNSAFVFLVFFFLNSAVEKSL